MKKEEIAVKLTKKNTKKMADILKANNFDITVELHLLDKPNLKKHFYLFYSTDKNEWTLSMDYSGDRTLIKPKQLKELLENEPPYTSKHWENPLWEVVKDDIGNKSEKDNLFWQEPHKTFNPIGVEGTWTIKGDEIISEPKNLEVGKWYKYPSLLDGRFMFKFMGEFGNGKAIGFDAIGKYHDKISVHERKIPEYTEAKPEEVIEAFIYHMENFADKRKNITTAELRDILNQFHREEISFSKVVELVNKGGE